MDKPTAGRIVHYKLEAGCRPAIVVAGNDDDTIELKVFMRGYELLMKTTEAVAEGTTPYTWHWPERA